MSFSKFMASPAGRILRIVVGAALITWGLLIGSTVWTVALVLIGLVPLAAGLFDWCLLAPLLGAPFQGKKIRDS